MKVTGNPATTVKLAAKQRTSMALALDAGGAGTANLDVDIKGPNGLTLARHYALDVKAATQILARRSIRTLAKGESLTLTLGHVLGSGAGHRQRRRCRSASPPRSMPRPS